MPTQNVNLTEELDNFVVLRTLEREEQQFEAKLAALRTAIDQGDASGTALGGSFRRVRRTLKLSHKKARPLLFKP